MITNRPTPPQILLNKFNKGERLNLSQLKFLNGHLWKEHRLSKSEEQAQKFRNKIDEVQEEIDYWVEVEKTFPFASFEKYTK